MISFLIKKNQLDGCIKNAWVGRMKISDLNTATELDPALQFPYKYRAGLMVEENQVAAAITEIDRILAFKVSANFLELQACWMQLYDHWSSVDDIGSLAVTHQMLENDPRMSLLWFWQSLLLLRPVGPIQLLTVDVPFRMCLISFVDLNNLGSVHIDCGKLDLAIDCYMKALDFKHTRAHQGLARVYHLKNQKTTAYDEMTKLIVKAKSNASANGKRSEYCD
ncbi:Tetratricopeptide repeat [Dillenia turbinata]|uniref:Tetratricopeptide repeat n=1 Tax=Dillenia turbinata TaxID=194707 RepID=A0AAN8V278_9MAGN